MRRELGTGHGRKGRATSVTPHPEVPHGYCPVPSHTIPGGRCRLYGAGRLPPMPHAGLPMLLSDAGSQEQKWFPHVEVRRTKPTPAWSLRDMQLLPHILACWSGVCPIREIKTPCPKACPATFEVPARRCAVRPRSATSFVGRQRTSCSPRRRLSEHEVLVVPSAGFARWTLGEGDGCSAAAVPTRIRHSDMTISLNPEGLRSS